MISIEVVKWTSRLYGAAMLPVQLVFGSLGTGGFFRRQLLILCDSKGPYLPRPRWSTTLWFFFSPRLILSQQSRAWDRLVRWRCEKRSARVLPESSGSQTRWQAYLHEADSTEGKISGNYWLVVDLLAQESQKKSQILEWIDDLFHYLIKKGRLCQFDSVTTFFFFNP